MGEDQRSSPATPTSPTASLPNGRLNRAPVSFVLGGLHNARIPSRCWHGCPPNRSCTERHKIRTTASRTGHLSSLISAAGDGRAKALGGRGGCLAWLTNQSRSGSPRPSPPGSHPAPLSCSARSRAATPTRSASSRRWAAPRALPARASGRCRRHHILSSCSTGHSSWPIAIFSGSSDCWRARTSESSRPIRSRPEPIEPEPSAVQPDPCLELASGQPA